MKKKNILNSTTQKQSFFIFWCVFFPLLLCLALYSWDHTVPSVLCFCAFFMPILCYYKLFEVYDFKWMNIITVHKCFIIGYFPNLGCLHCFQLCCYCIFLQWTYLAYNCFKYLRSFLLEDLPVSGILRQLPWVLLALGPMCPVASEDQDQQQSRKPSRVWFSTEDILTSEGTSPYLFPFLYKAPFTCLLL